MPSPSRANSRIRGVVEAQRFVLRDRDGRIRATLRTHADRRAALSFFDTEGKPGANLSVTPDGRAALVLVDTDRKPRARLHVTRDGAPILELYDWYGKCRARLTVEAYSRTPSLAFFDRGGKQTWRAPQTKYQHGEG